MVNFLSAAHTDTGIVKTINQDAFCLKTARTPNMNIALAVLCDGMGGLKSGELASALIVNEFSSWFENSLPDRVAAGRQLSNIRDEWDRMIVEKSNRIMRYGDEHGISLGTTLTAVLLFDREYLFAQVGDSRLYKLSSEIVQLTRDQTVVAREVEQHRLTPEQARVDKRKNILLQCVGASKNVQPEYGFGRINLGEAFLLCSDGFRHEVREEEMLGVLSPALHQEERTMKQGLIDLIETNKARGERDNITSIMIKVIG